MSPNTLDSTVYQRRVRAATIRHCCDDLERIGVPEEEGDDQGEGQRVKREVIESFAAELIAEYERIAREVPQHQVRDCLNIADEVRRRRDMRLACLSAATPPSPVVGRFAEAVSIIRECDSPDGFCGEMPDDLRERIETFLQSTDRERGSGDAP